jgi:hypothetical protein
MKENVLRSQAGRAISFSSQHDNFPIYGKGCADTTDTIKLH